MPFRYKKYLLGALIGFVFANELRENRLAELRNLFQTRFLKKFLLILSGLFLASALMIPWDRAILHWIQSHGGPSSWVTELGIQAVKHIWQILISLYVVGALFRLETWRKTVFSALVANALTAVFSIVLKFTLMRARPDQPDPFSFFNLNALKNQTAFQSFPSGDVAIVAGASGYFFFAVKNHFVKFLLLLIPFTTAYSRISVNRHWPTDTLFSVGLGFLVSYWVKSHQASISSQTSR